MIGRIEERGEFFHAPDRPHCTGQLGHLVGQHPAAQEHRSTGAINFYGMGVGDGPTCSRPNALLEDSVGYVVVTLKHTASFSNRTFSAMFDIATKTLNESLYFMTGMPLKVKRWRLPRFGSAKYIVKAPALNAPNSVQPKPSFFIEPLQQPTPRY